VLNFDLNYMWSTLVSEHLRTHAYGATIEQSAREGADGKECERNGKKEYL
jgi:hypothetical protein